MKLSRVDVQNFRKLKQCSIEFSDKETVFVGANNSGKTSAMDALIVFLKNKSQDLSVRDFTLSNWQSINDICLSWVDQNDTADAEIDLSRESWHPHLPTLDVWLTVDDDEVHYVSHIIPTLQWAGGDLGVRLVYEPKDIENLYKSYKPAYESAKTTSEACRGNFQLWPKSMRDFLEKDQVLHKNFSIKAYILDPNKATDALPQSLQCEAEPLNSDPFKGLFKVDIINAQRGFSDPNTADTSNSDRRLSSQLKGYFDKHLNPSELPDESDVEALQAIDAARKEFDKKLKESFQSSIGELEHLNYPGFSNPEILISSEVDPIQGLSHDAAVQFNICRNTGTDSRLDLLRLPEKYNGLGYQNLISMIFNLIRFRDEWMQVGKAKRSTLESQGFIEPLHIVLVEEPEAHLHAQVQQVFIKKSYDVLRNHPDLREGKSFSTQLVVSTHSSHLAHEIDFVSLRYFKRHQELSDGSIPTSTVVNLSNIFGDGSETAKFASRYLKATHCDLFFADAAILLEGPAERMLVPHFISKHFPNLNRCYICLLEIGGSHAHRLKPLIEALGLLTLVVTDLDSVEYKPRDEDAGTKAGYSKATPEKGKGLFTGNQTVKSWVPGKEDLDEALSVADHEKVKDGIVRSAYQCEMTLNFGGQQVTAIPYTFEDAVALENIDFFKSQTESTGLMKKIVKALDEDSISAACTEMFKALSKDSKKAEMALELLYSTEPEELSPPLYIREGLVWLEKSLLRRAPILAEAEAVEGEVEEAEA